MKTLHIIHLRCGKFNKKFDVTEMNKEDIEKLKLKHYKPGINFTKIM